MTGIIDNQCPMEYSAGDTTKVTECGGGMAVLYIGLVLQTGKIMVYFTAFS